MAFGSSFMSTHVKSYCGIPFKAYEVEDKVHKVSREVLVPHP